jgi:hypothetical protein
MNAVTKLNAHLTTITCPDELRELPAWLIWRYEHHEGEGKPRKVPYYTNGQRRHGVQGRAEDRQQLTTFDAARAAAARRGFDGVGFAPMPEFNVCALDFDRCVQGGEIHPQVLEVLGSTYAEYSPSGLGIRAFFRGNLGNLKDHGEPFGFETFSSKGFVTVTGNALEITQVLGNENSVAEVDDTVLTLVRRRFARASEPEADATTAERLGLTRSQLEEALDALPGDLGYDQWISVGMALHHELGPEGFQVWDEWSRRSPKYTTERYGRERWRSFGKGGGRQVTARSLVRLAHEHGAHITIGGPASVEEFEALVEQQEVDAEGAAVEQADKPNRFAVIPAAEFTARPSPSWIVKGVLPRAELVVLFGESGSGKSFIALDIAAAIDRGIAWRGKRVRQGRVVYICAEGAGGFRNRLVAYQHAHQCELGIGVIANAPNLLQREDALEVCRAIGRADVVIIDTFAQTTPGGNENAAEDMGKALAHCKGIHRATGALVILVHHAGKDLTRGARGWSGLKAAADAELEVLRLEAGRMLRTSKMKDGQDDEAWGFDLETQNIGIDEDGDVITSCTVREVELGTVQAQAARPMGAVEAVVHAVVMEMGQAQSSGIEIDAVLKEAVRRLPEPDSGKRDTRMQRSRRALKFLTEGDNAPFFAENGCLSVV